MASPDTKSPTIPSENLFRVVGIGASAGGLEAFKVFVKAIPRQSGMAYIFIQHLARQYESVLTEILQKITEIPVIEITDNIEVVPDNIYIIPPNRILTANDGVLLLEEIVSDERPNTIDIFFSSLAEIHQDQAIGIILSGTGSDGTVGLKVIKDQGGITIVQDKHSSTHYGMPQSAIDADVVDLILSPELMPNRLIQLVSNARHTDRAALTPEVKDEDVFKQILTLLRMKRGVDFTYYKQTTIRRRIIRRKALNNIKSLKGYLELLFENKGEQDELFKDILIPVTAFFRDPKTFSLLTEKFFPEIFKDKSSTDPIRIWVAGCSTGEEAYSIAICLHEYFGDSITTRHIQIFATDLSESVIAKARRGIYQKSDIAGLPEARVREFFTKIDGSYQVNKPIRAMCVFACQNFIMDPPFAKLDLISCRNVLIYLQSYLQKKAITTFHYALNPSGYLLLGKSETPGSPEKFQQVIPQEKMYKKIGLGGKFMQVATEKAETSLKTKNDQERNFDVGSDDYDKAADEALLKKYGAVGVVLNDQLDIIQFRGSTGPYLEARPGKVSLSILKMAREGLSFELRNAIHKAKLGNEITRKENISIDNGLKRVNIEVIPLQNTLDPYFLVLFETIEPNSRQGKKHTKKLSSEEQEQQNKELSRIDQLEKELAQVREDMRSITEDQEAANEELQSANEELLSGSEELQSLNEELETTREEIQSSNEELTIVNQELLERNDQLDYSRKYAEAIISTIHEPMLVLTGNFQVKSANKAYYAKFDTTEPETVSKKFFEIQGERWKIPGLKEKLETILPQHSFFENFEATISLPSGRKAVLLLNGRQLMNENSNEQLILLAVHDITQQKMWEQELELQVSERTLELKESNLNLQQLNENLRQFASIASHDLQEPLRKIKTFSSIFKRRFIAGIPEEGKLLLDKIEFSADRMSRLIKEVLEYSKISHGPTDFIVTDLNEVLSNVLQDLDLLISESNAIIHYEKPLPVIEAIPLQMNQLFYNLVSNALKFRNKDTQAEITVSSRALDGDEIKIYDQLQLDRRYTQIDMSDKGIGFNPQFSEQIFQLFERLHAVDEFEGTGLGLALCKRIVEHHGGHIFAESKEGQGATFCIILPDAQ